MQETIKGHPQLSGQHQQQSGQQNEVNLYVTVAVDE